MEADRIILIIYGLHNNVNAVISGASQNFRFKIIDNRFMRSDMKNLLHYLNLISKFKNLKF